nr:proton-conducting transporter membrane subunit [Roseomonas acroporae]
MTAYVLLLAVLVGLALAAPFLAGRRHGSVALHAGGGLVALAMAALALAALLGVGAPHAGLTLPLGPPGGAASRLALDGLSAWFLLLLGLSGSATALFALGHALPRPNRRHHAAGPADRAPVLAAQPLFLAGMALTLLAADAYTLLAGFELMSLASWVLVAADHEVAENRAAARLYLIVAACGAVALILAFGLLGAGAATGTPAGASAGTPPGTPGGLGMDLAFAALRAAPPEGWRAVAVLLLVLAGAGAKAGLVPLHVWLPLAHPAAPSHVSALMSGAMTKVSLYVLARVALDLCGPAQPVWWGVPILAAGVAAALLGALRATQESDAKVLLACSTIENVGLVAAGLGLAAAFRGADLGPLAALAAGAALLHALNHGVFKTLLFLAAGEVLHGAATRRLDRMGGLIRTMPWTAACALVGIAAAAALPPLSGFASEWLLLQALLAAPRVGDLAFQLVAAAAAACIGLAVALASAAMVRLFGLAFLGRFRTPRAAGAEDGPPVARWALALPAALTVLLGLIPGPLLDLAVPALRPLVGGTGLPGPQAFSLAAAEGPRYLPLPLALLLGLAGGALVLLLRARSPAGVETGPAWDCGFIPPPAHLPFGDPLTQPDAAGFAQPLRRMLAGPLLRRADRDAPDRSSLDRPGHGPPALRDPAWVLLFVPAARLRDALAAQAERLRGFTIRRCLTLSFATLVLLLAAIAWLERG